MAKLNVIKTKLQRAILTKGLVIKINTNQFYSADQNRLITMHVLSTPVMERNRDGEWKTKDYEILRTASMVDVVKCLQAIWEAMRGWK